MDVRLSLRPLNWNEEVRPATLRSFTCASALRISSAMPSEKYSSSLSALMFTNGSTAMAFSLIAACLPAPASASAVSVVAATRAASRRGASANLSKAKRPNASASSSTNMRSMRRRSSARKLKEPSPGSADSGSPREVAIATRIRPGAP